MVNIVKKLTKNRKEIVYGKNTPETIVVHHTGSGNATINAILRFFRRLDYLSVHFIVGRDGRVIQYVDEKDVAFHVGVSKWNGLTNLNYHSIGIEVVSDGYVYTEAQRNTVTDLCRHLMKKHNIPRENVIRHADAAMPRGRKWDIGKNFYSKWASWEGFQEHLDVSASAYHTEIMTAIEWVKLRKISNGERPDDPVTRAEMFVMLHRLWRNIKGLE